ncbi:MAG: hypothetical protein IJ814_02890 [Paludibacteraceae bacterium]|nr:hypothetical protein [Paludibacteraceae bacterium]
MKKFFSFFALALLSVSAFAQDCETVSSSFSGNASITFQRYTHKDLIGNFTIGEGKVVRFSQGNLQYRASSNKWRFAENQYDCVANGAISGNTTASSKRSTQSEWIDLYAWGTSGWDSGANFFQPWASSTTASDYRANESSAQNSPNADWAKYNAIINGGIASAPAPGDWRVLTTAEWLNLFNRTDANDRLLYAFGTLMTVSGVFLLPDGWDWNTIIAGLETGDVKTALTALSDGWAYGGKTFTNSVISDSDVWTVLENLGVVFLPVSGRRSGTSVSLETTYGYYWSSTDLNNIAQARGVLFYANYLAAQRNLNREWGCAVRPVHDVL